MVREEVILGIIIYLYYNSKTIVAEFNVPIRAVHLMDAVTHST